ncbi:precorrin-3B synthase (plasmid) [Rhizobium grahamii]|uniref:Precorrin-3B synthase n=2 Tax=Rhizobium grahamii TaxID=1120045 RepID=A0A5Q0CCY1_9HYPH|nr:MULTISPECIES: precorrin-3B synthase [Rhizobium]QFY63708.1 precorrin-3B synthase [Rhizobium grahamii]QRM51528.1 precorrin-3B synthase [Rhizobium sp. BG6]
MASAQSHHTDAGVVAASRRGACPSLAEPMQTGDGLLVRLRSRHGVLTLQQCRALGEAALRFGNGLLEITARGSIQIRGLTPERIGPLAAALHEAAIEIPKGPAIELPPLHGLFHENANAAALEDLVRQRLTALLDSKKLAAKLSIVIDGGGPFGLSAVPADIRLEAIGPERWLVLINTDGPKPLPVALGNAGEAVDCLEKLLRFLAENGGARWRDIPPDRLHATFPALQESSETVILAAPDAPLGPVQIDSAAIAYGLRARFGQMRAADLIGFVDDISHLNIQSLRPGPGRCLFLAGLAKSDIDTVADAARRHGLSTDANDPSIKMAACAGAGACASGYYHTRVLGEAMIDRWPGILDGSLAVHMSGCVKGCAERRAALTFAGVDGGYHVVLSGRASDPPDALIAGGDVESAIERLARLIEAEKQGGETTASCLARLGKKRIVGALRQE